MNMRTCIKLLCLVIPAGVTAAAEDAADPTAYAGWQTLRQFDCARCHGGNYEGSVGPSLVESARNRSRGDFDRLILEGTARGMPPYKSVAKVRDNLDGIHAYLRGRAEGSIGPGALKKP